MRRLTEGSSRAESLWDNIGNGTYEDIKPVKVPFGTLRLKVKGRAGINTKTGEVEVAWVTQGYAPDNAGGFIEVEYYCESKKEAEAFADKVAKFNFVEGVSYLIQDDNTSNWVFKG